LIHFFFVGPTVMLGDVLVQQAPCIVIRGGQFKEPSEFGVLGGLQNGARVICAMQRDVLASREVDREGNNSVRLPLNWKLEQALASLNL
jgi:hypothetical protein